MLLDDKIDFIQALQMPGTLEKQQVRDFSVKGMLRVTPTIQAEEITAAQQRKMTIEETRKSLPVYAFREQFIEAVKEHQVKLGKLMCYPPFS